MTKSRLYVGIDNGLSGAIVALSERGDVVAKALIPTVGKTQGNEIDAAAVFSIFAEIGDPERIVATLETPGKFSKGKQALTSMWDSYGVLRTVLVALKIRHHRIGPQVWQKVMLPGCKKGDTKPAAFTRAQQLWPSETWLASKLCKKPNGGFIDAALIAEYTRLKL